MKTGAPTSCPSTVTVTVRSRIWRQTHLKERYFWLHSQYLLTLGPLGAIYIEKEGGFRCVYCSAPGTTIPVGAVIMCSR